MGQRKGERGRGSDVCPGVIAPKLLTHTFVWRDRGVTGAHSLPIEGRRRRNSQAATCSEAVGEAQNFSLSQMPGEGRLPH